MTMAIPFAKFHDAVATMDHCGQNQHSNSDFPTIMDCPGATKHHQPWWKAYYLSIPGVGVQGKTHLP